MSARGMNNKDAPASPSPYEDVSIPAGSRCIRLLTIRKSTDGGIVCSSTVHNIDDEQCPEWMCLSYTWDTYEFDSKEMTWNRSSAQPTKDITLNGVRVRIRESLFAVLTHILLFVYGEKVGKPDDPETGPYDYENSKKWKYFWIDALAIDQQNLTELGHQVGLMSEIYSRGRAVMAYLEPAKGIDATGLKDAVRELLGRHRWEDTHYSDPLSWHLNFENGLPPSVDELPDNLRVHCRALEKHPYWGRMWVVQEISLARSILYFYGSDFAINEQASSPLSMILGGASYHTSYMPSVSLQGALAQRSAWRHQIRRGETKWWDVLWLHQSKSCMDPRDMVYGLLGLMPDDFPIEADYTITAPELFFLLVKQMNEKPKGAILDEPRRLISFCLRHLKLDQSPMVHKLADFALQDVPPDFIRAEDHDSLADLGLWILRHTDERWIFEVDLWSEEGPRGWLNEGEGRPILDRYLAFLEGGRTESDGEKDIVEADAHSAHEQS